MANGTILVTGGGGYIGSHVARQLREAGENVVILDDLSTGFERASGAISRSSSVVSTTR